MGAIPSYPCISCPILCQSPRHPATATSGSPHCAYMKNPLEIRQYYPSGCAGSVLLLRWSLNPAPQCWFLSLFSETWGSLVLYSQAFSSTACLRHVESFSSTSPLAAVMVLSLITRVVVDSILQSSFPVLHVCTHHFWSRAGWQLLILSSSPHFILGTVRGLSEIS